MKVDNRIIKGHEVDQGVLPFMALLTVRLYGQIVVRNKKNGALLVLFYSCKIF